jgi:molecular chaperone Hsp31 and glyoxalase 3
LFQILKTKIMIKKILIGLVSISVLAFITLYFSSRPNLEEDGSYSPSSLALILGTVSKTDFEEIKYTKYQGDKSKVLVIFTEQKNLEMKNGKSFSTGNHPVEALVPMLHLKNAGFDFEIATPTGKPVVFEMWAFPEQDEQVKAIYNEYKSSFEHPKKLTEFITNSFANDSSYAAVFIPGGHGAMIGIPDDRNVGKVLNWAHQNDLFTITLCHGPGALLSTTLDNQKFLYDGYKMAVFPDAIDEMTPLIGYLPGHMILGVSERLKNLGAIIVNTESDKTVCVDRKLITGASPLASNELGKLAANTLLKELN